MSAESFINTVGVGYDVHQFEEGRDCIIGGVKIEHEVGLKGHSDADVLSHAIADAVLGALGLPDIGHYFPPSDMSIEGISSLKILEKIYELSQEHGATIVNIDSTIIAEQPKVLPHAEAMKVKLGEALNLSPLLIGIKATTNEKMGFLGRGEGMSAMAVASVRRPNPTL